MSEGYTTNKSAYNSLEIIYSFDLLYYCEILILRHVSHKYVTVCAEFTEWNERLYIGKDQELIQLEQKYCNAM